MGIRAPATYNAALQRGSAVGSANTSRRFWVFGQFEGALALIARMRAADSLTAAASNSLVMSLSAVPLQDGEYDGGVAFWMRSELAKALPREGSWESARHRGDVRTVERSIRRLAFSGKARAIGSISRWRGATAARGRASQTGGHTLDLAFAIDDVARALRSPALTVDGAQRGGRSRRKPSFRNRPRGSVSRR